MAICRLLAAATFAALALIAPRPAQAVPFITITETLTATGGFFTVHNNQPASGGPYELMGFMIAQSNADDVESLRFGWSAMIVTQEEWDSGDFFLFGPTGQHLINPDAQDLGTFSQNFDTHTKALAYWMGYMSLGQPILQGESDKQFYWLDLDPVAASPFIAFVRSDEGGIELFYGEATHSETPLPAALPLFATGLGVMGYLNWRRRKRMSAAPASAAPVD